MKIVSSALCVLNLQLLGHLLVVAKNVAKQESLNEGYRVGKSLNHHIELYMLKYQLFIYSCFNIWVCFCPLQ